MTSKIIKTTWFSTMNSTHPIGVILCFNSITNKFQGYIGIGIGIEEKKDEDLIHKWGSTISKEIAIAYFGDIASEKADPRTFKVSTDYEI